MSRFFRHILRKLRYSSPIKRFFTVISFLLWLTVTTLWINQSVLKHHLVTFEEFPSSVVHKTIENWHLSDSDGKLPVNFPLINNKWSFYPEERLFLWKLRPLNDVRSIETLQASTAHGDMGEKVIVPENLRAEERKKYDKHRMNVVASDLISLNRRLPDVRHDRCHQKQYPSRLPQASVIIIFNNEALSTLLRTIHSVINRSPDNLLKEVILVDDASENEELQAGLDEHVARLPVHVRVHRLQTREGLIRARLAGAQLAEADVLVFLDAHTEATHGWLEPMLSEISKDRTRVTIPVIDDISQKDFSYDPAENDQARGGLDWKLMHAWIESSPEFRTPDSEEVSDNSDVTYPDDAVPTPIMIGCAFAIDREFFYAVGAYDNQMKIWGGENVEISVRVWRCGGSLLVVPCSHIGHVYRDSTPHSIPGGFQNKMNTLMINTARFAEVWLDNYTHFYYYLNPGAKQVNIGDLQSRKTLIGDLKCHSFQWFLDHVYKDAPFPTKEEYVGQVQQYPDGKCLGAPSTSKEGASVVSACIGLGGLQTLLYTKEKEIRSATRCLEPKVLKKNKNLKTLHFILCDFSANQKWEFKPANFENDGAVVPGQFIHQTSGKCLSYKSVKRSSEKSVLKFLANAALEASLRDPESAVLEDCKPGDEFQLWAMNLPADWTK